MGVFIVSAVTEAEWRREYDDRKARGQTSYATPSTFAQWQREIVSSPSTPLPKQARPAFPDAGKARGVEAARAELGKVFDKVGIDPRCHAAVAQGKPLIPGWAPTATDGHTAICRPTELEGRSFAGEQWRTLGTLPAEAWREYARVRVLRRREGLGKGAIMWTWGGGRLTWGARDDDGDTATGWYPWAAEVETPPTTIADAYMWALRGGTWELRYHSPTTPIVAVGPGADVAIVIMPMRI